MELLDVAVVEVDLGQRGRYLGIGEDAGLRALQYEELDLLEFLQFSY